MRLCELREKEVINICNCRRLGCVVDVDIDVCDGKVLAIDMPPSVSLKIVECDPSMRSASATARTKNATLETGLHIQVPDYIENSEIVRIDTRDGRYMSRA